MARGSNARPRRKVLERLLWSHTLLAIGLGLVAGLAVGGALYLAEDMTLQRILRSFDTGSVPLTRRYVSDLPPELAAEITALPDGVHELAGSDLEAHALLETEPDGRRRVSILQLEDTDQEGRVLVGLGVGLVSAFVLAAWMARRVTAKTLEPMEALVAELDDGLGGAASGLPGRTGPGTGPEADDELVFLAGRVRGLVQAHAERTERERRFLSDASHELRSPLTVLRGTLELLREAEGSAQPQVSDRLERMERSVGRMTVSVESLLGLARAEATARSGGEPALESGLAELLEEWDDAELPVFHLAFDREPGGHQGLWLVLLRNLIDNAVNHGQARNVWIEVSEQRVCVRDDGRGLDAQQARAIGEDLRAGRPPSGPGLGLAIVARIADRLGWSLELAQPGSEGTRFELRPTKAPAV